jgi:hypothetical protein
LLNSEADPQDIRAVVRGSAVPDGVDLGGLVALDLLSERFRIAGFALAWSTRAASVAPS